MDSRDELLHALVVATFPVNLVAVTALPEVVIVGSCTRHQLCFNRYFIHRSNLAIAMHTTCERLLRFEQVKPGENFQ